MIILSFWVSLTRISDYFHHPLDVIMGAIVGMTFAIITLIVIGDIFVRRSSFWKTLRIQEQQITMPDAIIREGFIESLDFQNFGADLLPPMKVWLNLFFWHHFNDKFALFSSLCLWTPLLVNESRNQPIQIWLWENPKVGSFKTNKNALLTIVLYHVLKGPIGTTEFNDNLRR